MFDCLHRFYCIAHQLFIYQKCIFLTKWWYTKYFVAIYSTTTLGILLILDSNLYHVVLFPVCQLYCHCSSTSCNCAYSWKPLMVSYLVSYFDHWYTPMGVGVLACWRTIRGLALFYTFWSGCCIFGLFLVSILYSIND